jgi:hypothetical protein
MDSFSQDPVGFCLGFFKMPHHYYSICWSNDRDWKPSRSIQASTIRAAATAVAKSYYRARVARRDKTLTFNLKLAAFSHPTTHRAYRYVFGYDKPQKKIVFVQSEKLYQSDKRFTIQTPKSSKCSYLGAPAYEKRFSHCIEPGSKKHRTVSAESPAKAAEKIAVSMARKNKAMSPTTTILVREITKLQPRSIVAVPVSVKRVVKSPRGGGGRRKTIIPIATAKSGGRLVAANSPRTGVKCVQGSPVFTQLRNRKRVTYFIKRDGTLGDEV